MAHGDDRDHHPPCLIAWRDEASFHPVHPGRASAAAAPPMLPPPPIDPAAGYETLKRKYRDTLEMHAQQIGQMQETQQLILQELHQVTTLLRAQGGHV